MDLIDSDTQSISLESFDIHERLVVFFFAMVVDSGKMIHDLSYPKAFTVELSRAGLVRYLYTGKARTKYKINKLAPRGELPRSCTIVAFGQLRVEESWRIY